jgi:hypothetical protein
MSLQLQADAATFSKKRDMNQKVKRSSIHVNILEFDASLVDAGKCAGWERIKRSSRTCRVLNSSMNPWNPAPKMQGFTDRACTHYSPYLGVFVVHKAVTFSANPTLTKGVCREQLR